MRILHSYLKKLHEIRNSGLATDERSYYSALDTLFNAVGSTLMPKVLAIHDIKNQGSGHPDYAIQDESTQDIRAVIEAKPTFLEVTEIMHSSQVKDYLSGYNLCLVVNFRDFALVQMGKNTQPEIIMRYNLALDEQNFWQTSPEILARQHDDGLTDFLINILTWNAILTHPKYLAQALARYARESLRRLEYQPANSLNSLRTALSEALGLHLTDEQGEHFFRSSLVQTLFYGLFSAWAVWCRNSNSNDLFRWRDAGDYLSLPVIRELFERIAIPNQLEMLDIRKPLEWAEATLRRTSWDHFEASFRGDAINYFYEPFLEAYDPQLREQLGVWYTPREIIRYQVSRLDHLLKEELNIPDGFADERVIVLDPATGTGGYLLEVLRSINTTLLEQGMGAMRSLELRNAAINRIFGFEVLPAPFVVAHMQIAILLSEQGVPFEDQKRASIFLTNSLTGWSTVEQLILPEFPALKKEAEAASSIKHKSKIIVILGNPPYRGPAGVAEDEEQELIAPYYIGLKERFNIQARGINELYVRFFRLAERQIAERVELGIISFISNNSWLTGVSHPIMREHMLNAFDKIWIDNLHGNRIISERTPNGNSCETVFAVQGQSSGIKVGTAVTTFLKRDPISKHHAQVYYRDVWGMPNEPITWGRAERKRAALVWSNSLNSEQISKLYRPIEPKEERYFVLVPGGTEGTYLLWPSLEEIFVHNYPGVKTSRDPDLIAFDSQVLRERMKHYFDPKLDDQEVTQYAPVLMRNASGYDAKATRRELLNTSCFQEDHIIQVAYRPFDGSILSCV